MSLIKTAISITREQKLSIYFIVLTIVNDFIFALISSELMIRIADGNFKLISLYLIIQVVTPLINNNIIKPITIKLTSKVKKQFNSKNITRYDKLSYDSKITKPFSNFEQALAPAQMAIVMFIDWGIPNIIYLISTIFCVIWTFYQKSLMMYFFLVIVICVVVYIFIIKKYQDNFTKLYKNLQKEKQTIQAKIQLDGIPFQYKECSIKYMINMNKDKINRDKLIDKSWYQISGLSNSTINMICCSITYFVSNNTNDFLLISIVLNQLNNAIQCMNHFMTQFNRMNNDFDTFTDFWKNTAEQEEPLKLNIKERPIDVEYVKIERKDYTIKLDPNFKNFRIHENQKILIEGPTGDGKSSFLKALFGMIPDSQVQLSYGEGKNFYHQVADYFQEIKEKIQTSKVSISDIFRGEQDVNKIKKYLLLAWNETEHDRIIKTIADSNNEGDSDSVIIDMENKHPYFMPINEKLSGGQKSRLLLWNRGYVTDELEKEIIILDEPCPDVDFDTYINTIKKFFKVYQYKIIIMVGHLCDCKRKKLNSDDMFDLELWIENGLIKKKRSKN